jgi:hypothetical protein
MLPTGSAGAAIRNQETNRAMNPDQISGAAAPRNSSADAAAQARSAPAGRVVADGVYHDYTALHATADDDSGMMGAGAGTPQVPGARQQGPAQQHGNGHHGHGLFSHGALGMAGVALGESDDGIVHHESDVGHLALGGDLANADKKPGAGNPNALPAHHDNADERSNRVSVAPEPVAAVEQQALVGAQPADMHGQWGVVAQPLPPVVHLSEVAAPAGSQPLVASYDSLVELAAPDSTMPDATAAVDALQAYGLGDDSAGSELGGKAAAGSRVSLYDNGALVDAVTAGDDGNWSLSPRLADGVHDLTTTITDTDGNVSLASELRITVADSASNAPVNLADAGLLPGAEFADSQDYLSLLQHLLADNTLNATDNGAAALDAVAGYAGFQLPEDTLQMQAEDAGDTSLLKLEGAAQAFDLSALNLSLGDLLEQGGKHLFADGEAGLARDQGGAAQPHDLLAAFGSDWAQPGSAAGAVHDYAAQPATGVSLEQLLQASEHSLT